MTAQPGLRVSLNSLNAKLEDCEAWGLNLALVRMSSGTVQEQCRLDYQGLLEAGLENGDSLAKEIQAIPGAQGASREGQGLSHFKKKIN